MRMWHVYKDWRGNYRHDHLTDGADRELALLGVKVEPSFGTYRVISRHRLCRAYNARSDPIAIDIRVYSHGQVASAKSG